MIFGQPFSVPFGIPDDFLQTVNVVNTGGGISVQFQPYSGYEQFYRLVVDGVPQGMPVWADSSALTTVNGTFAPGAGTHTWSIVGQGLWGSPLVDPAPQVAAYASPRADRIILNITGIPRFFSYGESAQLSAWALTGVQRFGNCKPVPKNPTWGRLDVTIATTGGVTTVTLWLDGISQASGSRTGSGSITLAPANGSGIAGTVTLTYSADVSTGAALIVDFPAKYKIYWSTATITFPRTAQATVNDNGTMVTKLFRSPVLTAGKYNVIVHQVDSQGNESAGTTPQTVIVVTVPAPPSAVHYVSGGYAATVIGWTPSDSAPGVSYHVYDSLDTEFLDMDVIAQTVTP